MAPATVSRFLNGGIELPPATAERIRSAIAELGYRPNPYARSLSRGRTDMLALAIPDIQNAFFSQLASAVDRCAEEQNLSLLLCSTANKTARELDFIERLRRRFFDGLLLATNHADDGTLAEAINTADSNIVLVDEDVPGARVAKVFSDNEQGGFLAGSHILAAGHRAIAYIGGPPKLMSTVERRQGLSNAISASSDARLVCCLEHDYTREHGRAAMAEIIAHHRDVTAVFAGSDEITLGVLEVLREHGLRVACDLSLVTFDDVGLLHLLDPPVTAIRQPTAEIGRKAFERLAAAITGESVEIATERLPVRLVERASVAAPRRA
ncbi:LacI family DNA-binding transcriptional regulator [Chelativorans sp. AA-79]|uniref:LacI family DNA-binding transcriptional regulator n=1 Tax=Chelativorans sp. AA-79 TaxID=3028735 RepID=UPI0023F8D871|nr:LacI family DNA-binding transcriptional regulator [Chelativorans sp. AA-79]WEX08029.1 LacI family DNA-binding transcriptional regulator [Chelativorans sp. AA-79]